MADSHFIAVEDIYISRGVCAHRKGDTVPAANVEANGWADKVARPSTKAAKDATAPKD